MSKQVLEMALEALLQWMEAYPLSISNGDRQSVVALKEAIEQQGEPVAEVVESTEADRYFKCDVLSGSMPAVGTLLYTSAPTIPAGWQLVQKAPSDHWCARFSEDTYKRWPLDSLRREIMAVLSAAPEYKGPA